MIAGEQPQVGIELGEQARLPVVAEVALADELDDGGIGAGAPGAARPGGGEQPERRLDPGLGHVGGDHRSLLAQLGGEVGKRVLRAGGLDGVHAQKINAVAGWITHRRIGQERASAKQSAAASQVLSIASSSWASETNQASNCDGGGKNPRSSIARQKRP